MRPLLQYYETLEAQTLWEGDIRMTVLVALIQETHVLVDVLRQGNEIADSPLVVDLSPASSWSLGGIILTSQMLYVIAFDNEDDAGGGEDDQAGAHPGGTIATPEKTSASLAEEGSPEHCFEAMLSRLPLFHVVVEDVVEAVQRLEVIEQPLTVQSSSTHMAAFLRLSTLSQDVNFILKSPKLFDNIDLPEVVHAFGILPSVDVEQRCFSPTTDQHEHKFRDSSSPMGNAHRRSASRATSNGTQQNYSRGLSTLPAWDTTEDPEGVGCAASERIQLVVRELEVRCQLVADEGFLRARLSHSLFQSTVDRITAHYTSILAAAKRDPLETGTVLPSCSVSSFSEDAALRGLLEAEERRVRIDLGAYLTDAKKTSGEALISAERANLLRESVAFKQRVSSELDMVNRNLKQMETALFEVSSSLNDVTKERDALKAREAHVVENARRREAELHAQLEEAQVGRH